MLQEIMLNVFNLKVLGFIVLGVSGGICIGALPGLTATMGVALMLPLTFGLDTLSGILLLLGIYIGAIYGGSVAAILLRTPGTPASAATVIDGYVFTKRNEGRRALTISTISSFIGGMVGCIVLITVSPHLSKVALQFGAPEFFMLAVFGLSIIAHVSGASLAKGIISGTFGILISTVGIDRITGYMRFTFGSINLVNGISYIPIMIGLFALSEVLSKLDKGIHAAQPHAQLDTSRLQKSDVKKIFKTAPFSGLLGTFIGIIPGAGADIGAFVAYNEAKRWSKHGEKFGTGITEGVAAAEAGNNGVTGGALVSMLTLGIPGDSVAAIMIGALTVQGLQPGPLLFKENSTLVYTIFLGLLVANVVMLLLGLLGVGIFSKVSIIPQGILMPVIIVLCIVGSYAINSNFFDVGVMIAFGIIGYYMQKSDIPLSPAVLGVILGPMAESNFRRALMLNEGKGIANFFQSPISIFFFCMILVTLFWVPLKRVFTMKKSIMR